MLLVFYKFSKNIYYIIINSTILNACLFSLAIPDGSSRKTELFFTLGSDASVTRCFSSTHDIK